MNKINKKRDVLRFIDLYKSHQVLWNMNLSSYRRNDLKMEAYEAIADEMQMPVEVVRKKIKSLRTAYSAEKSKVEKSIKFGTDEDSMYVPTVFWYNEMNFLDAFLIRRATIDNTYQEDVDTLVEPSVKREVNELSSPESSCEEEEIIPTAICSNKRKRSPEIKSKFDDALDKLIAINNGTTMLATFGDNVAKQMKEFPEEVACQLMADIQTMLSKRKLELLGNDREAKSRIHSAKASNAVKKIIPMLDRILVQRAETLGMTKGGIVLPEKAQGKMMHGTVVAVGPGGRNIQTGTTIPMEVKAGDRVLLPEYGGTKVELEDKKEYLLYRESDILARVE